MGARGRTNAFSHTTKTFLRTALFWDITQRRVVILHRRLGQRIGPIFKGQEVEEENKAGKTVRSLYRGTCGNQ